MSAAALNLIADPDNMILVSHVSVWETAIKIRTQQLKLAQPVEVFYSNQVQQNDFRYLSIELSHLAPIAEMPLHHRDPFDRLLIAQCLVEGISITSADAAFDAYVGIQRT